MNEAVLGGELPKATVGMTATAAPSTPATTRM